MRTEPAIPYYKQLPLLRFLLALMVGIVVQWYVPQRIGLYGITAAILALVYVGVGWYKFHFIQPWTTIRGLCLLLLVSVLGSVVTWVNTIYHQPNWYGLWLPKSENICITLQETPIEKVNSYKAVGELTQVWVNKQWQGTKGKVIVYFEKDSTLPSSLPAGTVIVTPSVPQALQNAGNPGGFNYTTYSVMQGVTHQVYLAAGSFKVVNTQQLALVPNYLLRMQNWLLATLARYIPTPNELAVSEALLIGYRTHLERDLVQAYSNTGIVHIIAISGMHLGMIYGLCWWLLSWFGRWKRWQWVQGLVTLFVIWLFTGLAGAAPSILRSAVMFTCLILGTMANKQTSSLNSLVVSAVILLLINPFSLWDVGFQLSYAAVSSIILFQPFISQYITSKQPFLRWVAGMVSVTLAAQIATLPFVLYHFHQFPLLFLFTNIIAVPVSGAVLYGEMFLVAVAWCQPLATVVGYVLTKIIFWLNTWVVAVSDTRWGLLQNVQINIPQAALLLFAILCLAQWVRLRKPLALRVAATAITLCIVGQIADYWYKSEQKLLIVYNVPKQVAVDVVTGFETTFLGDSVLLEDGFLQNFHIKPSRVLHRSTVQQAFAVPPTGILTVHAQQVLWLNGQFAQLDSGVAKVKYIIVSNNVFPKPELIQSLPPVPIIVDGSNKPWLARKWKTVCNSLHLRCHNVTQDGAFVANL